MELFSINGTLRHPKNMNGVELTPTKTGIKGNFLVIDYLEGDPDRHRQVHVIYNDQGREVLQVSGDWRGPAPKPAPKLSFWQRLKSQRMRPHAY